MLQCVETWPLLHRNKVEDSKIEEPVQQCVQSEDERLKTLAEKVRGTRKILLMTFNEYNFIASESMGKSRNSLSNTEKNESCKFHVFKLIGQV